MDLETGFFVTQSQQDKGGGRIRPFSRPQWNSEFFIGMKLDMSPDHSLRVNSEKARKKIFGAWGPPQVSRQKFFFLIQIKWMFVDRIRSADYEYQHKKVHKCFVS